MFKKDFRVDFCVNCIRLFGGHPISNREFGSEALTTRIKRQVKMSNFEQYLTGNRMCKPQND